MRPSVAVIGAAAIVLTSLPAEAAPSATDPVATNPVDGDARPPRGEVAPEVDRFGWAVPDYLRLQTGGFLGMVTLTIGYSALRDVVNVGLSYGYVPPLRGAPHVHLGSGIVSLRPLRWTFGAQDRFHYYPVYVGGGVMVASSPNLFVTQPAIYPDGYYPPNAVNFLALFGTEIAVRQNRGQPLVRQSLFVEFITLHPYLDALNQNKHLSLLEVFSTAFGYRASF